MSEEPRELTVREAGRRGGNATAAKRTPDERRDHSSHGGRAAAEQCGSEHFSRMGQKGAAETNRRREMEATRNGERKPNRTQKLIERALKPDQDVNEP